VKRFFQSDAWVWCRVGIELILIALIIVAGVGILKDIGLAEEEEFSYTEAYIICDPENYVNIRMGPSRKSCECGWKSAGDKIYLDGKKKNGYLHIVDGYLGYGIGWIHSGFVVYDEPERMNATATIVSRGRLAARKYVNGKRTRWLKPGASVVVYFWSDEWCLTNCGYVKSQFLELE